MLLTLGNWILIGFVALIGIGVIVVAINESFDRKERRRIGVIGSVITIGICVGLMFGFNWYHSSIASGIRNYKDWKSDWENGIYREITITAEDGREIFHYEGKFDMERHEEGDDRYLRFESQDGKRYTISYGIQDTVLVIEKDEGEK